MCLLLVKVIKIKLIMKNKDDFVYNKTILLNRRGKKGEKIVFYRAYAGGFVWF